MSYECIGDIADIQTGPFGSQLHQEDYVSFGTPIVTVEHLGQRKMTIQNLPYVSDDDKKRLSKYCLLKGDLVFSRVGSVDRCSYVSNEENDWMFSGRCLRVRCDCSKVYPLYLYYYFCLETTKQTIRNVAVGATMPSINTKLLSNIPFLYKQLSTQKAIAETLSCLDDKIELNNRINKNLEVQAQAIFKSWFVDFEPFQNGEFVESELGLIPRGWRVGTLGEISDIVMGQSPSGSSYNENGEGMVFYQGRAEFGERFPNRRLFTTEPKREAQENDILLSVRAPVGDFNIATEKCCIGRGLASIAPKPNFYSYCVCLMGHLKPYFDTYNREGTVFGSINKANLNNMKVIIPTIDVVKKFDVLICDINKIILSYFRQNKTLSTLRDTLLPKLMSGEIQIPQEV